MTTARKEAQRLGLPTYEGVPCKLGHTTRYTSNCNCVKCENDREANRRRADPTIGPRNTRAWKEANRDRNLANAKNSLVRRRRLIGGQSLSKRYSTEIREIYKECPDGHHVDHIIPLRGEVVCGLHVPWNLQYLPASDNDKKGNKYVP